MGNSRLKLTVLCLLGFLAARAVFAGSGSNLVVSFVTTNLSPLNVGFAGFATSLIDNGMESHNPNFQQMAATLSPGWLRYPSGIPSDGFDWTLQGQGGLLISEFASLAQNVGGAKIIVCLNGFTDSPQSASNFVAYALTNHIPVAAWELCNEPYNFTGTTNFFLNGMAYAQQMYPYYQAIKGANSNALVSIFFGDPISYHHYPRGTNYTNFSDLMAFDNGELLTNSTSYVTNVLIANAGTNANNVKFLLSESGPVEGGGVGGSGPMPPSTTLYGGIYASELMMRLSTCPQMLFAGTYQIFNQNGIYATNTDRMAVTNAAAHNYVTNTDSFNFGFYYSAQAAGQGVAFWAINRSTALYSTTVGTNGPTVPLLNGSNMPAIYAQAYQGGNGKRYVLITNKGSNSPMVNIMQESGMVTNQLLETYVTGNDPSATNSSPTNSPIFVQSQTATNPLTIPQYSVVRLEWPAFSVPTPVLTATSGGRGTNYLRWTGLAGVVYNVQSTTNLLGPWATLGRITNSQTNFTFTDYSANNTTFYRLVVP
jgi:hypothetical protein